MIHTHDVVIRNAGTKPATNVRVSHAVPLPQFNINPPVPHTVQQVPGGHEDIVIPTLVPKQQIVDWSEDVPSGEQPRDRSELLEFGREPSSRFRTPSKSSTA